MGKLDKLGSAVKKAGDAAMATAEARFNAVDSFLGTKPAATPSSPPAAGVPAPVELAAAPAPNLEPETASELQAAAKTTAPETEVIRKKLTVMLSEADWKAFRFRCVDEGLTGQDILERLVQEYLAS